VHWGTLPQQRTVRATLGTLDAAALAAPSVIVIGEVAGQRLSWFESRPLSGRRVVVTRAEAQARPLVARLRELGAEPVPVPAIEIGAASDGGAALRRALAGVRDYAWLVLTSANGVEHTFASLPDSRALAGVQVAAIGPGTADALRRYRIVADLIPPRFVAEALLEVFPDPEGPRSGAPGRVLLARAAVARDVLPDGLRSRGWEVDVVEAYRTQARAPSPGELRAVEGADAVLFTSSSTVDSFVAAVGVDRVPAVVACIGPVTAETARRAGLAVTVEAAVHTVDGLVDALVAGLGPAPADGAA
jgi:uroporphyrinogen-III synthase